MSMTSLNMTSAAPSAAGRVPGADSEVAGPTAEQRRPGVFRRLTKHRGAGTLLDQVFVSLTNFSTGIFIGRACSKEELGLYMLGYSVLLFAIALQQMLISSPYILIWPRLEGERARRYTRGAYSQQFAFCLSLALLLLVAGIAFHLRGSRLSLVLLAYAFAAPLVLFKEMFRRVCFTHLKVRTAVFADSVIGVIQILLFCIAAFAHRLSAPVGVAIVAIAGSSLVGWCVLRNKGVDSFAGKEAREVLAQNWHLGRWIFGSQLLWASSLYAYPWLISRLRNTAEAGVWAACFGINALGNPLLLGLQNYIEPRISHAFAGGSRHGLRTLVWRATAVLLGSMLAFSAVIFLLGNRAVTMLYGAKYAGNGLTIFLITLSFAAGAAGFAFSCGFFASGHGNLDMRISWIYPIALIACGLPLVSRYGPVGGALGLVIANSASTLLRAVQFLITFRADAPPSSRPADPAFVS